MNIQIFGTKKCNETKKAERFFKERGIKYQFVDMKEKGARRPGDACFARTGAERRQSKGEFSSVAQANGGVDEMINTDCKDKDLLALVQYLSGDDKLETILENQSLIKTPVVRNGKQSTVGYQPEVWKKWE